MTIGRHQSSLSPWDGVQPRLPVLTVQQRSRESVQHARGTLGDPLRHQRGAGTHRLCRHLAAGSSVPFQRPVIEDLHHGLFQGCVGAGGRDGEGETPGTTPRCSRDASPPAEPGNPLCSSPPTLKTPQKGKGFTHPGPKSSEASGGWPRLSPCHVSPPGSPRQDVVIDQCQGEQPGAVQPPQVDLIPKDEGGGGDALLPQQERRLRPEGEVGTRDVQHRDEGGFGSRGGLWRGG